MGTWRRGLVTFTCLLRVFWAIGAAAAQAAAADAITVAGSAQDLSSFNDSEKSACDEEYQGEQEEEEEKEGEEKEEKEGEEKEEKEGEEEEIKQGKVEATWGSVAEEVTRTRMATSCRQSGCPPRCLAARTSPSDSVATERGCGGEVGHVVTLLQTGAALFLTVAIVQSMLDSQLPSCPLKLGYQGPWTYLLPLALFVLIGSWIAVEILCCMGRATPWDEVDDEVDIVASLLGDVMAYRAVGAQSPGATRRASSFSGQSPATSCRCPHLLLPLLFPTTHLNVLPSTTAATPLSSTAAPCL
ncbi:unnamed protein product [Closterium sp. Yama58-4]|nr:unnamed protein product [Closterium sp. Yama58-4]